MGNVTDLKGDSKGGILDKLINGGELPKIKLSVETQTFVNLGITIVVSALIIILANALLKVTILKN